MTEKWIWVTGGAGFLGTAIVRRLLATDKAVRCLVRNPASAKALLEVSRPDPGRLDVLIGSLNAPADCRALVDGCGTGIHAAAAGTGSTPTLFMNNVVSTRILLEAVRDGGCERMVLVSSLAVHATGHLRRGELLDERCPLEPRPHLRDPYTFSKVAQERLCLDAEREWGLPLVVVRPGVIYGPGRDCITSRVGLRVGPLLAQMGGRHKLPYTYVENCADAIVAASEAPHIEGEAFNIVDNDLPRGNDLIRIHRNRRGRLAVLKIPTFAVRPLSSCYHWYSRHSHGQVPPVLTRYRSDASWKPLRYSNAKSRALLRWEPRVGLREALDRTLPPLQPGRA